jgi:hypothetical protein
MNEDARTEIMAKLLHPIRVAGAVLAIVALLVATAPADVTTKDTVLSARPGQDIFVPLILQTTAGEQVAGINGQMTYDTDYFSAPEIQMGPAALGFTVLGNSVEPGKFRFVVYADPTAVMGQVTPAMYVKLTAAGVLPQDGTTEISFLNGPVDVSDPDKAGESSAATPDGVSIGNVTFNTVTVALNESAADDWVLYK